MRYLGTTLLSGTYNPPKEQDPFLAFDIDWCLDTLNDIWRPPFHIPFLADTAPSDEDI